ncbi:hypothetical protein JTB14_023104 [Gonioctena quinquepunctata]|nr:hypothetical protein JTB14_023104 [Gonioctena quinquepunctata]
MYKSHNSHYPSRDDSQLLSWSVSTNQSTKVTQLAADLYPTDMQFLPRVSGTLGKHGDLILITSVDGKFHIMNRAGKIERSVDAHKGAILVGQWGNDGTGLLTAGEDGLIKIWSRSGMLRSTVVSSESSVYGASWSPDSQAIAYTQGKCLVVKQLAPNTKPLKAKALEASSLWSTSGYITIEKATYPSKLQNDTYETKKSKVLTMVNVTMFSKEAPDKKYSSLGFLRKSWSLTTTTG